METPREFDKRMEAIFTAAGWRNPVVTTEAYLREQMSKTPETHPHLFETDAEYWARIEAEAQAGMTPELVKAIYG